MLRALARWERSALGARIDAAREKAQGRRRKFPPAGGQKTFQDRPEPPRARVSCPTVVP